MRMMAGLDSCPAEEREAGYRRVVQPWEVPLDGREMLRHLARAPRLLRAHAAHVTRRCSCCCNKKQVDSKAACRLPLSLPQATLPP